MVQFRWGSVCIKGNFRDNNEDRCAVDPQVRFFLVADGMGGQNAGERASQLATDLIPRKLDELVDFENGSEAEIVAGIDEAISAANAEIMSVGELDPSCKNMGTTIVFLVAAADHLYIGGVGDSRVYQYRDETLTQLTIDHTLTEALLRAGTINAEEAKNHRYQNVLHRYLGSKQGSEGTEPCKVEPQAGDRYLLCSDGVTGGVEDEQLQELIAGEDDPQKAAEIIVKAAQDGGSKDNITCIVLHVEG